MSNHCNFRQIIFNIYTKYTKKNKTRQDNKKLKYKRIEGNCAQIAKQRVFGREILLLERLSLEQKLKCLKKLKRIKPYFEN